MKALLIALLTAGSVPATAEPIDHWAPFISEAAKRFRLQEQWIRRVMETESGGQRVIVSPAGAMGLMQLMPDTWNDMKALLRLGDDPFNPRDNILAGAAYLRILHDRFGIPGMFAAYNAGPARYAHHLSTGQKLPQETIAYVAAVAGAGSLPTGGGKPSLFAIVRPVIEGGAEIATTKDKPQSLFVEIHEVEEK